MRHNFRDKFRFYFGTWTGRILLVNFILFVIISISSMSIFAPDTYVLITWGAKDPVGIARGEWWRFFVPIFLHFGILHFALNSIALKFIGSYLEPMLGSLWFLIIYFGTGIGGNVLSAVTNVSLGAGASGAIFGLIGVGMLIEQIIMRKEGFPWTKLGPFTYMAIINIAFAVVFNFISYLAAGGRIGIDNAAHLGGLFSGVILGYAMLSVKKNRLVQTHSSLGLLSLLLLILALGFGVKKAMDPKYIYQEMLIEAEKDKEPARAYYYYSQALFLNDSDPRVRFKRGRSLMLLDEVHYAMKDLIYCTQYPALERDFDALHAELVMTGHTEAAQKLQMLIERMKKTYKKI